MESIFHEKQEGYLCAQHCLNALLQGPYFTAVDLADLAESLDEEERKRMAESGIDSEDYKNFIMQPSGNMDDSGYFSIQVISSALEVWGLELIPFTSKEHVADMAKKDPSQMNAYICNFKGHWFTIRKIGNQWFNLNSMQKEPTLLTDTYLNIYLDQLIRSCYSIFIVIGNLPRCPADEVLSNNPVIVEKSQSSVSVPPKQQSQGYRLGTKDDQETELLKTALALGEIVVPSTSIVRPDVETISEESRERIIPIKVEGRDDGDDDDENAAFQKAIQMSFQNMDTNQQSPDDEEKELQKAIQLSLECMTAPSTPDAEDIRQRRLRHFSNHSLSSQDSSSKIDPESEKSEKEQSEK